MLIRSFVLLLWPRVSISFDCVPQCVPRTFPRTFGYMFPSPIATPSVLHSFPTLSVHLVWVSHDFVRALLMRFTCALLRTFPSAFPLRSAIRFPWNPRVPSHIPRASAAVPGVPCAFRRSSFSLNLTFDRNLSQGRHPKVSETHLWATPDFPSHLTLGYNQRRHPILPVFVGVLMGFHPRSTCICCEFPYAFACLLSQCSLARIFPVRQYSPKKDTRN